MKPRGYLELGKDDYAEFERLVGIYRSNPTQKSIVDKFFSQWRYQQRLPAWLKDGISVPCIYWHGVAVLTRPGQ